MWAELACFLSTVDTLVGGTELGATGKTARLAFLLAGCTSVIATLGFLFEQGGRIPSMRRSIGDFLTILGAPGFVVGATVTGGHQTTLVATAIAGTILNVVLYFFVWFVILRLVQTMKNKSG